MHKRTHSTTKNDADVYWERGYLSFYKKEKSKLQLVMRMHHMNGIEEGCSALTESAKVCKSREVTRNDNCIKKLKEEFDAYEKLLTDSRVLFEE
jgi:hypothetical protein